jgi:hypothetical protein
MASGTSRLAALAAVSTVLLSTSALAQVPALRGTINVEYSRVDSDDGLDGDVFTGAGDVMADLFFNGFALQGHTSYDHLAVDGPDPNIWTIGGAAFWRNPMGAIAAVVSHAMIENGTDADLTSYGVYGEGYLTPYVTLFAKGGGYDGTGDIDGHYYGAGLRVYPLPYLAATAHFERVHSDTIGDITDYGLTGEVMLAWFMPFSVYGAYTYTDLPAGVPHLNTWTAGIRVYFGDETAPLIEQDRTGPLRDPFMTAPKVL